MEIARVNASDISTTPKQPTLAPLAALKGLAPTIQGKLILIAGGDAKGADIASLSPYLTKCIARLFGQRCTPV